MKALRLVPRFGDWPWALKLGLLLVTTAILPLIALTLYGDIAARRAAVADSSARNVQRARTTAGVLDSYLRELVSDVTIVALGRSTVSVLRDPADPARAGELQALLANLQRTKRLSAVTVVNDSGTIVASTERRLVDQNRITRPYFLSAMAGQTLVHDPRHSSEDGQMYVDAAAPVRDERGRVLGVAAARVPLAEFDRVIAADTNFGGLGEYGLLWDERGVAISAPSAPERLFRPLGRLVRSTRDRLIAERRFGPATRELLSAPGPGDQLVRRSLWLMYDDEVDPMTRVDLGRGLLQVAAAPLRDRRWTYAIVAPEANVLARADEQRFRIVAVAIATGLAALLAAIVSARRLSRPLKEVRNAAGALAAGDMSRRVRLSRRDEIGQMAGAFDAMADALARKDAELREHADSLERHVAERTAELRGLLAAIPDLLFKVDREGRLIDYLAAKEEDLVMPPERFLGRHLSEVMPPHISTPALAAVERVLRDAAVPPFEYELVIGRETRLYEARASASGSATVVFLIRDITDRRRSEERMRFLNRAGTVLASSLDYGNVVDTLAQLAVPFTGDICVVDVLERGKVRCAAVAAVTPQLQAIVQGMRLRFPVAAASEHPVARALREGPLMLDSVPQTILRTFAQSPEHLAILERIGATSMMVLPLVARGQTLGAMTFVSTTTRQYAEHDLMLAQELSHRAGIALDNARLYRDLQESNRLKDEFLGIVSHELRTPLNAVLGWAQVIRRAPHDPEQLRRAIDAIERNAWAQAQLVEDLLDMSRAISGRIRIAIEPVDVRVLLEGAVESFAPIARTRGLELTTEVGVEVGPIQADAARLQQVIGNLLSNAMKFTPAGGSVLVSASRVEGWVEIRVTDSGSGITPEFLPYVFDRFRQADTTTTRSHGGLGIGLAIARHLVELHGGTIRAESPGEGKGATFTVRLAAPTGAELTVAGAGREVPASGLAAPASERGQATGEPTMRPSNR